MNLLAWLDRFPPCLVRLVARKKHGFARLSHAEIAQRSGLSISTVSLLSSRTTWRRIPPETIEAFTKGCGINLFRLHKEFHRLRRPRTRSTHIRRAKGPARQMYVRIGKLLAKRNEDARRNQRGPEGGPLLSTPNA